MGISIKLLLILNIFTNAWLEFNKIANINLLKSKAENAFHNNDYSKAVLYYDSLISFYKSDDEMIRLNLAHSLFKNEDKRRATTEYKTLSKSTDTQISSIAFQQLGFIEAMKGKNNEAINNFKLALKTNPSNEIARYNYELLKKLMEQDLSSSNKQTGNNNDSSKKNQKEGITNIINEDGSSSSSKGEKKENGQLRESNESGKKQNKRPSDKSSNNEQELKSEIKGNQEKEKLKIRLSEMNMTHEKANKILQEMNNEEIQYIQQLKRKPLTKENKMKQDW